MISNCEKVKALGIKVLLFTSNENDTKEKSLKRVDNWNENSLRKSLLFILCGIILLNIPLIILSDIFAPCHIIISCKNCE